VQAERPVPHSAWFSSGKPAAYMSSSMSCVGFFVQANFVCTVLGLLSLRECMLTRCKHNKAMLHAYTFQEPGRTEAVIHLGQDMLLQQVNYGEQQG